MKRTCFFVGLLLFPMLTGCGSGIPEALLVVGESGTRTFIDILLSDLMIDVPDYFSFAPGAGGDDGDGTDNGNGGHGCDGDGGGGTDLIGDPTHGETLFASVCTVCHCASAATCTGTRVNLECIGFARIQEKLQGEGFHAGGKYPDFTEQDLADLATFLGS